MHKGKNLWINKKILPEETSSVAKIDDMLGQVFSFRFISEKGGVREGHWDLHELWQLQRKTNVRETCYNNEQSEVMIYERHIKSLLRHENWDDNNKEQHTLKYAKLGVGVSLNHTARTRW